MTNEMILVPRAELLAWAKAWLNDYGPNDGTDCVTPFDLYLMKSPVEAQPVAWPDGLLDRVKEAERRVVDGCDSFSLPADPSDVDLVLAEVRALLEGCDPPFWIKPPSATVGVQRKYPDDGNGDDDAYNRGWNDCLGALAQQPAADTLADTQRAIIEAAERRGYDRAMSERPVTVDKAGQQ